MALCEHVLTPFDNDRQRLSAAGNDSRRQVVPVINKMAVKHQEGEMETPDSSIMTITGNSSSLWGICPSILALPGTGIHN